MNPIYHPRHWKTWLLFLPLRLLSRLPFQLQLSIGRRLGQWGLPLLTRRREIARINLKLCFPTYSEQQINQLLLQHFKSLGMYLFESTLGWWGARKKLEPLISISGLEHLDQALQRGKGVLLFSAHFTTLDLSGIMLATRRPIHAVYRPNENPIIDHIIKSGRERTLASTIPRDNIRQMVKLLKNGEVVWYAMDQNFSHKGMVFSNFFEIPAATNTATSRLVKLTGAAVIPFFAYRKKDQSGYELKLLPPLEIDGNHTQSETDQLNQLIEEAIQYSPEQYLWIHRRFKDRPDNQPSYYK
ncbi:MAG: LpxL/LpxP family Kdo(2)-lipid IV(A) lauroyl/palmitoleoyl acyltransferase [Candidatus Marinimicrobia bacterium]|jgi:Kdo2-lipid IVA lauroyltransferase/acyltransferase|nr:LpxL/LpxP family Kdo(2)-lipid IV(A) lauroyl/palmitoleoyl acyltransferase [Candidatus Neomarinimicrobiota bacterium]MBT4947400.1 LpxL/LpxP family Kdo(2)-lipid IV(A) lauroyl/palmitoleoyl acyltransferase [Candidatus Neomarinimicrobiota bacterium]MBT5271464.1 LpxL/LpxP family Kdo(2)-lipid IV(A) lauroyl/palmitoleoyl acyltransferase [Candidatus Neomarinimicrobiota bacterium]MBT6011738.1 LpxL/LpxP family Kdo(2)-lipid IV(A) lauroyl/palmitoleoyl acyltransferase [Candidatus Neomarinimicrobiota bacteriu